MNNWFVLISVFLLLFLHSCAPTTLSLQTPRVEKGSGRLSADVVMVYDFSEGERQYRYSDSSGNMKKEIWDFPTDDPFYSYPSMGIRFGNRVQISPSVTGAGFGLSGKYHFLSMPYKGRPFSNLNAALFAEATAGALLSNSLTAGGSIIAGSDISEHLELVGSVGYLYLKQNDYDKEGWEYIDEEGTSYIADSFTALTTSLLFQAGLVYSVRNISFTLGASFPILLYEDQWSSVINDDIPEDVPLAPAPHYEDNIKVHLRFSFHP